jgi:hypothetical protein
MSALPRSNKYAYQFCGASQRWQRAPAPAAPAAAAAHGAGPAGEAAPAAPAPPAADSLSIMALDPQLAAHEGHLRYRQQQYLRTKASIERHEGSLAAFALGYQKMGITRQGGATVYREWAPGAAAAQLIGDFNGWAGTWMQRDDFGVWSVTLPDGAPRATAPPLAALFLCWMVGACLQHAARCRAGRSRGVVSVAEGRCHAS